MLNYIINKIHICGKVNEVWGACFSKSSMAEPHIFSEIDRCLKVQYWHYIKSVWFILACLSDWKQYKDRVRVG